MASVEFVDLVKRYAAFQAIHGISLKIEDGSFVALVGPSGCGKSTLLRMVAGLEEISDGELWIKDVVVNDVPPKHRDIAMVFQNYALYPHMTVERNMGVPLRLRGVRRSVRREKVLEAAKILGLETLLDRYPRQLSGGQRQRVAMGRAIVRAPQVFLFDEPLSNLDAKLRTQMRTELKDLHQRLATTTLFVTHDQIEAMTLADVVVVMNEGRIEQSGTPLDLYDRPKTLFVAEFIGSPSMNLIPGTMQLDGTPRFETDSGIAIPMPAHRNAKEGQRVIAGIRPEHLRIDPQGFPFTVGVVEPTGAEVQVTGRANDHPVIALFRERVEMRPGDQVRLSVDSDLIHLFDQKSGARIQERLTHLAT